ncbi:DUF1206 domain-containing protein [Yinghuangia sp. YIM S09857]|uniref:DUF1206 domain-containing protein n=1 Tax=Yinghuangia sp. YIM S09857 TaxID=3436929 RepID=UPI003F53C095
MSASGSAVQDAGREAAGSRWFGALARAGLVARGVNYVLVGAIAVRIGVDASSQEADRQGALRAVAGQPGGSAMLWAIAVGFAGLAVWRLVETLYGQPVPDGDKPGKRLTSLARGVLYAAICAGVVTFILEDARRRQDGGGQSTDTQSKDLTARTMEQTGGRWLVLAVGLTVAAAGVVMVVNALRRRFTRKLKLGEMSAESRRLVEALGVVGRSARGVVVCAVGVFLIAAAAKYDAREAKGLDDTLRETASGPLGPWPLYAIAVGLIVFGVYCAFEARYRKVHPKNAAG